MKIVLSLLEQFISLPKGTTPQTLAVALTQLGHEVEGIHTSGGNFPNVVIGHIKERIQHPNADRLGVCQVDVGEGTLRQIVCGAPNARAGLTVAVAMPGAVLPGDFKIGASKIRGVESNGMICSLDELGMAQERAEGIWEMDTKAKPGTVLNDIMGPGETVMDLAITPNRGDCFSHLGIARDLAALGTGKLIPLKSPRKKPTTDHRSPITVKVATHTEGCPQFNALELTGLKNAPSPLAVQKQLEALGLRPKNALVDATNYTMLALGQPLHAYDAAKVKGTLAARAAKGGETFHGIGDVELKLNEGETVITDDTGILGLGGILGGTGSAIAEGTSHVILEAAYFDPIRTALTGQAHQLHTDARQRFERGVDPEMTQQALLFCAHLITQWAGGKVSGMATAGKGVAAPKPISYNPSFYQTFIGADVKPARQKALLKALHFKVEGRPNSESRIPNSGSWQVTPPTYRTYMTTPEDLTEEILRLEGYESVTPQLPPSMPGQFQVNSAPVILDRTARKALAATGFLESISYSFIGTPTAEMFASGQELIHLANPLAQTDMTTLRPSLIPGLISAHKSNLAKSENAPRLAEVGKVFSAKGEKLMAAAILAPTATRAWRRGEGAPDAFTAKAAAQAVLSLLGAPVESATVSREAPSWYHPGRSGTLAVGPFVLAHFGELHPATAKALDVPAVAIFELHLEPLLKLTAKPRPWQPMPYPAVKRDLAFLLPQDVTAQQVVATIRASNQTLLRAVEVFDHYIGERIPAGKQSLALSLTLQSPEKTLAEADITPIIQAAVQAVETKHQAQLRA
ncbi:MAG: phenylalanine--tRNA ligase subunit beta [Proteobacteria bacterium]|nr:phenylalanine--tRNA ligase subunit beta [Pseudomonadota bacterium]